MLRYTAALLHDATGQWKNYVARIEPCKDFFGGIAAREDRED